MSEKLVFKVILDQVPIHHLEVVEKKNQKQLLTVSPGLLKAGK